MLTAPADAVARAEESRLCAIHRQHHDEAIVAVVPR